MIQKPADKTMAQMNIKLPATMKQEIKASASISGVPLKQIAQDALLLYLDGADDTLMTRRALVVNAFKEISKKSANLANSTTARCMCW